MNNNVFDWTRFRKVVAMDINNLWRRGGLTLVIVALLPTAMWLFWWAVSSISHVCDIVPEFRWSIIGGLVLLSCMLAPSRLYKECNLPKEGIYFAMLPASKLEKYLSMVLNCVVIYPLLCLGGAVAMDLLLTLLPIGPYSQWLWQTDLAEAMLETMNADPQGHIFASHFFSGMMVFSLLLSYLENASIFIFTGTIFKKHKFIKTVLWLWLFSFVLEIILTPVFGILTFGDHLEWLDDVDPDTLVKSLFYIGNGLNVATAALLFWWSARRLKRMTY